MHCRKHSYTACISVYVWYQPLALMCMIVLNGNCAGYCNRECMTLHATTPINAKKLLYGTYLHYVRFKYHYC